MKRSTVSACAETPILDRQEPALEAFEARHLFQRSNLGRLVSAVPGLILFSIFFGVMLPQIMVWLVVCVLAHELGHLLAGLAIRWKFRCFLAGPFSISKHSDGLRFRFLPRRFLGGGHVFMVPRSTAEWFRHRLLIVGAGGPFVTALMFVPIFVLPFSQLTFCLGIANALVAASSWIPMRAHGQANDARMLIRLAKTPARNFVAIGRLWAQDYAGISPRNWPAEIVSQLDIIADDPAFGSLARRYRYLYMRECGDRFEAAVALESVLMCASELPPDERRNYFSEAAFFQGTFGNSSRLAREWLQEARKIDAAPPERDWDAYPLAAVAIAEGDPVAARLYIA
jgi:hypothetical protein